MPFTAVPIAFEFDQVLGQIRWKGIVIAPTGGGGGSKFDASDPGAYSVPPGSIIGSLVRASGNFSCLLADYTGQATMPCMGMIIAKPTPVTATIGYNGELTGLVGLVAGTAFYCGVGVMTSTPPTNAQSGYIAQPVAIAINASTVMFNPSLNYTVI
jgi:hypothetical protein